MEKLEGLWIDDGTSISNSERLTPFDLNQRLLIKQMNELVNVLNKLYQESKYLAKQVEKLEKG